MNAGKLGSYYDYVQAVRKESMDQWKAMRKLQEFRSKLHSVEAERDDALRKKEEYAFIAASSASSGMSALGFVNSTRISTRKVVTLSEATLSALMEFERFLNYENIKDIAINSK